MDNSGQKLEKQAADLYSIAYARSYKENDLEALTNLNSMFVKSILSESFRNLESQRDHFGDKVRVLDIGCGTGRFFHCFDNNAIVTGLDVSLDMLEEARRPVGLSDNMMPDLNLIQGTLTSEFVSEHENAFDLIYSVGVYGAHAKYSNDILDFCREMLKPNGIAIIDVTDIQTVVIARQKKWYGNLLRILLQLRLFEKLLRKLSPRLDKYVSSNTINNYCEQTLDAKSIAMEINNTKWSGKTHFVYLQKIKRDR